MALTISAEPVPLAVDADGVVRVGGTRVTLDSLVAAYHSGLTVEGIVQQYPSLRLADVHGAIRWMLNNPNELDAYLRERQAVASAVRRENEARFDPVGVKERLLARLHAE